MFQEAIDTLDTTQRQEVITVLDMEALGISSTDYMECGRVSLLSVRTLPGHLMGYDGAEHILHDELGQRDAAAGEELVHAAAEFLYQGEDRIVDDGKGYEDECRYLPYNSA